jgi:hypothetical protein
MHTNYTTPDATDGLFDTSAVHLAEVFGRRTKDAIRAGRDPYEAARMAFSYAFKASPFLPIHANPAIDPLENLELLAAACQLAPYINTFRHDAWGTGSAAWRPLNAKERQRFIDAAIAVLRTFQPGPEYPAHPPVVMTGLRIVRDDNVVGTIGVPEPETCLYCSARPQDPVFTPYCGAICAVDAERG